VCTLRKSVTADEVNAAYKAAAESKEWEGILQYTEDAIVSSDIIGNPQLVADDAGQLVGWCDIRRETIPVYAHAGHLGMGLLPAYRGRGIGERLLRAAIDAARAAGFERVELTVYARNVRALALYRKVGFAHEGTRVRGKKLDGEYDDVHMMGLVL
jgi:RimJ/RimL family protein N-acetyltransferase